MDRTSPDDATEAKRVRQRDALIALTNALGRESSELLFNVQEITEAVADALEVARVSVWRYTPGKEVIRCLDQFEAATGSHTQGQELSGAAYPRYFRALAESQIIDADEAMFDSRTAEFRESYLTPLGIGSMLDAPLRVERDVAGVLCHEHVGSARTWTTDEKTFALAAANLVSLLLEQQKRREAEEALRRSQALLQVASRVGHLGAWSVDIPTLHHEWTEEARRIHEVEPDRKFAVAELLEFYVAGDRERLAALFDQCATTGVPFDGEFQFVTGKNRRRWVRAIGEAVRDHAGAIVRVHGAIQDLTERKQMEEQHLRAQRLESLGTLAGGIAHDLNNVLTPILMSIGLLQEDEEDPARLQVLATIESSAKRGAEMVRQVLQFARGTEGQRVTVNLRTLIAELAKILAETFPRNIRVDQRVPSDLWMVQGDPTQLHQVLLNLCVNARDAMADGGTLSLTAENLLVDEQYAAMHGDARVAAYATITIEDTGTGMSKEILDRIFDPFFTTKEVGKGTGWGLPASAAIARSHGGFIHVYSVPGQGSRFRLYLPTAAALHEVEHAPAGPLRVGGGELVLLVDDEEPIRHMTRLTLEGAGYRALLASDGAEALALYKRHRGDIAIVLTDMMMPGLDGSVVIRTLRQDNPGLRIIAASGLDSRSPEAAAADLFLSKPYTARSVLQAVSDVLARTLNDD